MRFAGGSNPFLGSLATDALSSIDNERNEWMNRASTGTLRNAGMKKLGKRMAPMPVSSGSSGADFGSLFAGLGDIVRGFSPGPGFVQPPGTRGIGPFADGNLYARALGRF